MWRDIKYYGNKSIMAINKSWKKRQCWGETAIKVVREGLTKKGGI